MQIEFTIISSNLIKYVDQDASLVLCLCLDDMQANCRRPYVIDYGNTESENDSQHSNQIHELNEA